MVTEHEAHPFWITQLRTALRQGNLSPNTIEVCLHWARCFLDYHGGLPRPVTPAHLDAFLGSEYRQGPRSRLQRHLALRAIQTLCREVAEQDTDWFRSYLSARPELRQLDVLKREPLKSILAELHSWRLLAARLAYGTGLTLDQCLSLRMRNLDLPRRKLQLYDEESDRVLREAPVPATQVAGLEAHGRELRDRHIRTFSENSRGARLPSRIALDTPELGRSWAWQFLFPEELAGRFGPSETERPGQPVPTRILLGALDRAALEAGVAIQFTNRTLRNSYAIHRVQEGHSAREVRAELGISGSDLPGSLDPASESGPDTAVRAAGSPSSPGSPVR